MNHSRLVFILIVETHATPGAIKSIIDQMQKHSIYFVKPKQYPQISSKIGQVAVTDYKNEAS